MRCEPCFAKIITGFANYNRCRFFFFYFIYFSGNNSNVDAV